jgi:hypothetical protein
MPTVHPSWDIKDTIETALGQRTKEAIQTAMQKIPRADDKIYAARYLDAEIKQNQKKIFSLEARNAAFIGSYNSVHLIFEAPFAEIKKYGDALGIDILRDPVKENQAETDQKKAALQNYGLRLQIAREALQVNENSLYRSIYHARSEQERNRKWYQHGAFAITLGLLTSFLVLPPILIYYFWKKDREHEDIQLNPLSQQEWLALRATRKAVKARINEGQNAGIFTIGAPSEKERFCVEKAPSDPKDRPMYVTRIKKERDQYFLNNNFFYVGSSERHKIQRSKEEDLEFHLRTGII